MVSHRCIFCLLSDLLNSNQNAVISLFCTSLMFEPVVVVDHLNSLYPIYSCRMNNCYKTF